jgi:hypothetical protein
VVFIGKLKNIFSVLGDKPFTKLIVPWYKESFTLTDEQIADRQFTAATGTAQDILAASTTVIIQNEQFTYMRLEFDDVSDPSNLWNDTTYVYSPNAIGYYSLFTNITSLHSISTRVRQAYCPH